MKAIVGWLVLLAVVVGGAAYGYGIYQDAQRKHAYASERNALEKDFLEQSVGLRLLDADKYRQEVGIALTRYHSKVVQLGKEYPDQFDLQRRKKLAQKRLEAGKIKAQQAEGVAERVDFTVDLFNKMRSGQYRPLYTDADKTFRFDIFDISPVETERGKRVRFSYVHWGAFGPVEYNSILGNIRTEATEKNERKTARQITADNAPPTLQIDPQRWVKEFLPNVEIGYYDLPLFPKSATAVDLSFDFSIRTVGGTPLEAHIDFDEVPISDSWKVQEGEDWAGNERIVADEEELRAASADD